MPPPHTVKVTQQSVAYIMKSKTESNRGREGGMGPVSMGSDLRSDLVIRLTGR